MTDVVVFPQSGYANRLQAMASAAILAESLKAAWYVCWELQPVAPARPEDLFSGAMVSEHFVTSDEARIRWGLVKSDLPLYLTADTAVDRIVVAGHDRGEQSLMPELRQLIERNPPAVLAIVAGGKFALEGNATLTPNQAAMFRDQRLRFYRHLEFAPAVEDAAFEATRSREPFLGLHLRYSDRSREAPWRARIWPAVRKLTDATGLTQVFVASDTGRERSRWLRTLEAHGLEAWSAPPATSDRSDPTSALGALVDWRILSRSVAMAYFSASSFAEEAAVASGGFDRGVGLAPSMSRALVVRAREYSAAAVTYPRRHGWIGSSSGV